MKRTGYNPLAARKALAPLVAGLKALLPRLPPGPLADDITDALRTADDGPRMQVLMYLAEVELGLKEPPPVRDCFGKATYRRRH